MSLKSIFKGWGGEIRVKGDASFNHEANALIRDFEKLGILQKITGQQRVRGYAFDRYLRLFVS